MKIGGPEFGKRLIVLGITLFVISSLVFPDLLRLGMESVEVFMFMTSFGLIIWGIIELFQLFRFRTTG